MALWKKVLSLILRSIEEKVPIMHEWYGQVHQLILKEYVAR